jgi:transcription termination factor Rho
LYSRGNGLLKEEKSLEEIHKIREKIYKMDENEKKELLKKIKEKYKYLFE